MDSISRLIKISSRIVLALGTLCALYGLVGGIYQAVNDNWGRLASLNGGTSTPVLSMEACLFGLIAVSSLLVGLLGSFLLRALAKKLKKKE